MCRDVDMSHAVIPSIIFFFLHETHVELIYEDVNIPEKRAKLENQEVDVDLPGEGQFYCIPCARHFIDQPNLDSHKKTKIHRRRYVTIIFLPC